MTVKKVLSNTIGMAHWITNEYLKDMSDSELMIRAVPGMNHIAWQLGHLIASERNMMTGLGHAMPELPAGFEAAHSKETANIDDPRKFSTKAEYLALYRKLHDASLAALEATPDADFDKPGPESMRSYAPTIGDVFNLVGTHEIMHSGQYVAVRRKLGKPIAF